MAVALQSQNGTFLCKTAMSRPASKQESEELQILLLSALEQGEVPDTRVLTLQDGQTKVGSSPDEQAAIKGALDSLATKEVRP